MQDVSVSFLENMTSKINEFYENIPIYIKVLGAAVSVGGIALLLWKKLLAKPKEEEIEETINAPPDTVVLRQLPRGPFAPSLVPFAMKVETYLRLTKIPYMNVFGMKKSSKQKWPWIQFNGQEVADSEFILKFLNKKFNTNVDAGFSEADLAAAHCVQRMLEEYTYWAFVLSRWAFDKTFYLSNLFKTSKSQQLDHKKRVLETTFKHGIGRHIEEEVYEVMRDDLRAVSEFLGKKKYLLGDRPCQADCAIFGQLAQYYWQCVGTPAESTIKEFQNLCDYCDRMKTEFWPDWDDCITHGCTREATK